MMSWVFWPLRAFLAVVKGVMALLVFALVVVGLIQVVGLVGGLR